jgi:hypothetical protein
VNIGKGRLFAQIDLDKPERELPPKPFRHNQASRRDVRLTILVGDMLDAGLRFPARW